MCIYKQAPSYRHTVSSGDEVMSPKFKSLRFSDVFCPQMDFAVFSKIILAQCCKTEYKIKYSMFYLKYVTFKILIYFGNSTKILVKLTTIFDSVNG